MVGNDKMYTIYLLENGKFECHGMVQDGTERWTEDTLEKAIKSMIEFAKYGNHAKITKKNISFKKPIQRVITEWIDCKPDR